MSLFVANGAFKLNSVGGYNTLWDVYLTIPHQAFILHRQVCKLAPSISVVSVSNDH